MSHATCQHVSYNGWRQLWTSMPNKLLALTEYVLGPSLAGTPQEDFIRCGTHLEQEKCILMVRGQRSICNLDQRSSRVERHTIQMDLEWGDLPNPTSRCHIGTPFYLDRGVKRAGTCLKGPFLLLISPCCINILCVHAIPCVDLDLYCMQ